MKTLRNAIGAILFLPMTSFGAAGMFDQFLIVSTGTSTYYDIDAVTGNPDFQGSALGTFLNTDTLQLGGQGKSYKNNFTDVTGMLLSYRLYSGAPSGSFQSLNYAFQSNLVAPGDQQWGTDVAGANGTAFFTSNLLTGLANGTYTLELYSSITTNGVNEASTVFNNNGGNNFTATFTVIPEPSRALLLGLGLFGLIMRRRRGAID